MPLNCSSVSIKVPQGHGFGLWRRNHNNYSREFTRPNHVRAFFVVERRTKSFSQPFIGCVSSKLNQSFCSSTMAEQSDLGQESSFGTELFWHDKELEVGVRAVQMACALCQRVQEGLISKTSGNGVQAKDDNSPVTIAG